MNTSKNKVSNEILNDRENQIEADISFNLKFADLDCSLKLSLDLSDLEIPLFECEDKEIYQKAQSINRIYNSMKPFINRLIFSKKIIKKLLENKLIDKSVINLVIHHTPHDEFKSFLQREFA